MCGHYLLITKYAGKHIYSYKHTYSCKDPVQPVLHPEHALCCQKEKKRHDVLFHHTFFLGSILRLLEIPFGCQDATARLNNTKPNKNTPDGSREDEKWFNREKEHGENGKRIPLVSPTYQVISVLLQILTAEKPHKTRGGRSGDTQRDYCSSDQTDELQLKGHKITMLLIYKVRVIKFTTKSVI